MSQSARGILGALLLLLPVLPAGAADSPAPPPLPASYAPPTNAVALSLQQAIETALANNVDISISLYDLASSEQGIRSAKGYFDPLLSFEAQNSDSTQPRSTSLDATLSESKNRSGSLSLSQTLYYGASYRVDFNAFRSETNNPFQTVNPSYSGTLGLTYTQPLLRNLGRKANLYGVRVAKNNARISDEAFRGRVIDIVQQVVYAYWDVVASQEALLVAYSQLDLARDQLRQNKIMVDVGTLPPIDVVQAEAEVASAEEAILRAENALRNAEDGLRLLLNHPPESPLWDFPIRAVDAPPRNPVPADLDSALEQAMHNRPEIRQLELDLKNRQLTVDLQKNQLLPRLDLYFSRAYSGLSGVIKEPLDIDGDTIPDIEAADGTFSDAWEQIRHRDFDATTVGLTFSYPLLNRTARAALAEARLSYDRGLAEKESLLDGVRVEVRTAVRNLETDLKRIDAAGANRELRERQLEAEQKKFENGMSTNFEVLTYQNQVAAARLSEISAIIDYAKSIAGMQKATGTLLESYGIDLASIR